MRISDWSSDVCSSDLHGALCVEMEDEAAGLAALPVDALDDVVDLFPAADQPPVALRAHAADPEAVAVGIDDEIGLAWGAKVTRPHEQREVPEAAFQRALFVHLVLATHRVHQLDGDTDA